MLLISFLLNKMELATKLIEKIVYNTSPKIEEHMLIVMHKRTHEEHLSQLLQTNNEQFKLAITFLTSYNGIFNVINSNNKFFFLKSITENEIIQITLPPGAYELESLNDEIKRIIIDEAHYSESNYSFTVKPNYSTLGSTIEISSQGPIITFEPDDSIRDFFGFNKTTIYEEYNLSQNSVDILSFENVFLECDVAQVMIYRGKQSGIIHNCTMTVNPGFKYVESFTGGITWYMMESKDNISSICFK